MEWAGTIVRVTGSRKPQRVNIVPAPVWAGHRMLSACRARLMHDLQTRLW